MTRRYLGARTPFGTIIRLSDFGYNPVATVRAKGGSTREYRFSFLIAHGSTLAVDEHLEDDQPESEHVQEALTIGEQRSG